MFTFLTLEEVSNHVLPGQLACDNKGAMAKVTLNTDIFRQMAPYFRYLEASSGAHAPIWSSPYLDELGLGLMVTIAVPVYSNVTNRLVRCFCYLALEVQKFKERMTQLFAQLQVLFP